MTLNAYLQDTQVLVRDPNYLWSTRDQQVRWINQARSDLCRRTGCLRYLVAGQSPWGSAAQMGNLLTGPALIGQLPGAAANGPAGQVQNSLALITNVEAYPYSFFNPYLTATYAGTSAIIDVHSISVNWGGAMRIAPRWLPWPDFQAYARSYPTLTSAYPSLWTVLNDGPNGTIFVYPIPSQVCEVELDVDAIPADLAADDDYEPIPDGLRQSIKYKAAALAFLAREKYAQSQVMQGEYEMTHLVTRAAYDKGKVPDFYAKSF